MGVLKTSVDALKNCPRCHGAGFVRTLSASRGKNISHLELCGCREKACLCERIPPYFYRDDEKRELRPCVCRDPRLEMEKIETLMHQSQIPVKYRYRTLDSFNTDDSHEEIARNLHSIHQKAAELVENFGRDEIEFIQGLYIYGPSGTGKTFLACIVLNELILRYRSRVRYMKITRDFFNRMRESYNAESDLYGRGDDLFQQLIASEVLVIDDFGVQADSAWEQRTLYDLIDARYENESTTIITSNHPPKDIESSFKSRIYSRLKEMTAFSELIAQDYRSIFQPTAE